MDSYTTVAVASPIVAEQPEVPVCYEGGGGGTGINNSCVIA